MWLEVKCALLQAWKWVEKMHALSPGYILIIGGYSTDNWPGGQRLLFNVCIIPWQIENEDQFVEDQFCGLHLSVMAGLRIWSCDKCALISGILLLELWFHSWCSVYISFPFEQSRWLVCQGLQLQSPRALSIYCHNVVVNIICSK